MFRVLSFNPTHRQLIVGSDPDRAHDTETRIELYFGNVEYMALRTLFRGMNIRAASVLEREQIGVRYGIVQNLDYLFILDSAAPISFIVSSKPSWREAYRRVDEPSLFDFTRPWPSDPAARWGTVE